MSAVQRAEPDARGEWSATTHGVAGVVECLPAVDLPTLDAAASLLTRVDRKYVVALATFDRLVHGLAELGGWQALEVDRRRLFGYESVYFDTPDLATYRAHLQGRRRRSKVRVRTYLDSGAAMLEVKRKAERGSTVKHRRAHPVWEPYDLGRAGRAFVADSLAEYATLDTAALGPVVVTSNHRATLACLADRTRLTVDTDLVCGWGTSSSALRAGHVVLESKTERHAGPVDGLLRRLGERPVEISKYCIGVASLGLDIPSNPWRRTLRDHFSPSPAAEERPSINPAMIRP